MAGSKCHPLHDLGVTVLLRRTNPNDGTVRVNLLGVSSELPFILLDGLFAAVDCIDLLLPLGATYTGDVAPHVDVNGAANAVLGRTTLKDVLDESGNIRHHVLLNGASKLGR